MNPTIVLSPSEPAFRLVRPSTEKWAATLEEERRRLLEDQEALREREENLRRYEARLRVLQEEIAAGRSAPPMRVASTPPIHVRSMEQVVPGDEIALKTAWDRLHRARELLEAEQAHMREDRHALREHEAALKQREIAVTLREQALAEHELRLTAETTEAEPVASEQTLSAVTRLTRVPFDMARSVFGGKPAQSS